MTEIKKIKELVQQELAEANEIHPQFHSDHEAWAVIKEEIDECADEMDGIQKVFEETWEEIKEDRSIKEWLKLTERFAIDLIREAIQVAAMCEKGVARYDKD